MKINKKITAGVIAVLVAVTGYVGLSTDVKCLTADYKYELENGQFYCVDDKDIDILMNRQDKVSEVMEVYKANGAFADKVKEKLKAEYNTEKKTKDGVDYDFDVNKYTLVRKVLIEEMKGMSIKDKDSYVLSGTTMLDGEAVIELDTKKLFEDLIINK